jgi:cytochrome-b5 reductase
LLRKYTPISKINDYSFFDIAIKIYFKDTHLEYPKGGVVSQAIDALKIGDVLEMSGPRGKIVYQGNGLFEIADDKGQKTERRVRHIGMVAGGTGISPLFQIIQYVAMTKGENLNISLIYSNRSEADIILRPELEELVAEQKLHLYLVVDTPSEGWVGGQGFVSKEMLTSRLPPPGKDTLICHCGPRPMNQLVRRLLLELGYSEDMIVKF